MTVIPPNADVRTYRASCLQDALRRIRTELGPEAAVLHTREVSSGLLGRLLGSRRTIEVTASNQVNVPSRLPAEVAVAAVAAPVVAKQEVATKREEKRPAVVTTPTSQFRDRLREHLRSHDDEKTPDLNEHASSRRNNASQDKETTSHLLTDLLDAGLTSELAHELLEATVRRVEERDRGDAVLLRSRMLRIVEDRLRIAGPIQVAAGERRVVALVGPTGVGKTTTIAKLAANFRLHEKRRVGLITVDTYRIAAAEQLRTYAEIIDLPMEVVSTPKELRIALARFSDLDLVLMDTAGRSPRDEAQIQELRSMLVEAAAHETHLVLSSVTAPDALARSVEKFSRVGATHMILTKIDEAAGLGLLLPLLQRGELPLSYLTHGQNVPQDIQTAERRATSRLILGFGDK